MSENIWSQRNSKVFFRFACAKSDTYKRAQALIIGFVLWKRKLFVKLKTNNVKIPVRSNKGKTLLETLVESKEVPERLKKEIYALIRARERIIPYILPVLRRVAVRYLIIKLKISPFDIEKIIHSVDFEKVFAHAVRQGLDRTSYDNAGIRLDFVLSAMSRLLPEIYKKYSTLRISYDNNPEPGEISESTISFRKFFD